jgi:hypothetical protein
MRSLSSVPPVFGRWGWCCGVMLAALMATGCGDSPTRPEPPPPPPPPPPVNNTPPTITSITVQGSRRNEPANLADLSEAVPVSAVVTDPETAVDLLQYNWTATLGSFAGTGARVTWVAPTAAVTPATVTVTLEVVERFGTNQENKVSRTATVALHDSVTEVSNMSVRFLTEFSKPQDNKNINDIMRDFKASVCPVPGEVTDEQTQVQNHYQNFYMHSYFIQPVRVTVDFGGTCIDGFGPLRGDACSAVSVMWDSTDLRNNNRSVTRGIDYLTAMFVAAENRWWLCSSRLPPTPLIGNRFYLR